MSRVVHVSHVCRVTCKRRVTRSHPPYTPSHTPDPPQTFRVSQPSIPEPWTSKPTTHESTRVTRQIHQTCHESHVPTHVSRPNGSVFHPRRMAHLRWQDVESLFLGNTEEGSRMKLSDWTLYCKSPSPGSPSLVVKPNGLCTRRSGVRATALARVFWISRGLSRYSPMSEVFAPRYLAGLVSTHG